MRKTFDDQLAQLNKELIAMGALCENVIAMAAGTVTQVYDDGHMGTTVVVDHGNGLTTLYANLAQQPTVKTGDAVETGTILGTVGGTAIAESGMDSHLHLEAWDDGAPADPMDYLPEK